MGVGVRVELDRLDEVHRQFHREVNQALSDGAVSAQGKAQQLAPVDTGRLRASLHTEETSPFTWEVSTNVEYAPYQEFGTRYQGGKAFMRPAYEVQRPLIISAVERSLRNL